MQLFTIASLLALSASAVAASLPGNSVGDVTTLDKRVGAEVVTCYNSGAMSDRARIIAAINNFCSRNMGKKINNGETISFNYSYEPITILVSAAAINGCSFTVDNNCGRLLRKPVDECNTRGEDVKQGGYVTDLCGQWRLDPNYQ